MGQVINIPIAFTLHIDTSGLSISDQDGIMLIVWEDTNANNQFEVTEDYSMLKAKATCSIFGGGASFVYLDAAPLIGWFYIDTTITLTTVNQTLLTGAELEPFVGL